MEVSIHLTAEQTPKAVAHESVEGGFIVIEFGHDVCLYLPGYGLDCMTAAKQLVDALTRVTRAGLMTEVSHEHGALSNSQP